MPLKLVMIVVQGSEQLSPTFFSSMEELRMVVIEQADWMCNQYIKREVESGVYPSYKASGMAYIRFAKEERELFKLLYMRDRSAEVVPKEMELGDEMKSLLHDNTGLTGAEAEFFHLEMCPRHSNHVCHRLFES